MNRFLKQWRLTGCAEAFHSHVSRMLTTSSSSVADALLRLWRGRRGEMTKLKLALNEAKASLSLHARV